MRMNEGQLPEQLFWRWVNLCEQKGISLSERHRAAGEHVARKREDKKILTPDRSSLFCR